MVEPGLRWRGREGNRGVLDGHFPERGVNWALKREPNYDLVDCSPRHFSQNGEKARQLCSRIAQRLNVRNGVRLAFSLTAASLDGLFDHPVDSLPVICDSTASVGSETPQCFSAAS